LEHLATAAEVSHEQALAEHVVRTHPAVLAVQFQQYAGLEAELVAEIARRSGADPTGLAPRLMAAALIAALRAAVFEATLR